MGEQMADTKSESKGLKLHDQLGRDIEPEHARIALAGDVFLTYEATDLPPMGAECQITLKGTITGPVQLKQVKEEDLNIWVTVVKLKAEEKIGQLEVIALPPPPDNELDLGVPGNGNAGGGTNRGSR